MKTRVFIVDDHPTMQQGLCALIGAEPDLEICGQVRTIADALTQVVAQKPDVALVDITLPDGSGLDLTAALRVLCPQMAILVVSVGPAEEHATKSRRAGATAYASKTDSPLALLTALRNARALAAHEPRQPALPLLSKALRRGAILARGRRDLLSEREQEIMRLIGSGRDTQEISILLRMSPRQIEAHRTTLRRKLNAASAVDLVRFCVLGSSGGGNAAVA